MFRIKCNHKWRVTEISNVLQLDEMGYPLRLVICKCDKCGKSDQQWWDVSEEALVRIKEVRYENCKMG